MNLISGEIISNESGPAFHSISVNIELPEKYSSAEPGPATLGIRPGQIGIKPAGDLQKKILLVEPLGKDTLLYFESEEERGLIAIVDSNSKYSAGDTVFLDLLPQHIFLFDGNGQRVLN